MASARRNNLAAALAKLEHGSRPEEIDQARAVTAVRLGLELPATHDRMWESVSIGAGGSAEIRLTERE